jgi:ferredoxin
MKVVVDLAKCQNHGQCTYSAPSVFSLDNEGQLSFRREASETYVSPEIDAAHEEDVEEAADMCPVLAISLER